MTDLLQLPNETRAELARRAHDAADWGHCLDCGANVDALAGQVLCRPCDDEAAAWEAENADRRDELARRVIAEAEAAGPWIGRHDQPDTDEPELPLAA